MTNEQISKIRASFWDSESFLSLTIMDKYLENKRLQEDNGISLDVFIDAGKKFLTEQDFDMAQEMEGF
jgi:hypothetical protein